MSAHVRCRRSESGQIFVWAAFLLPIMLVAAGLTFDVGNMINVRDELESAVDAAAVAAAQTIQDPNTTEAKMRQAAQTVAAKNNVASVSKNANNAHPVQIGLNTSNAEGGDVVIGTYDFVTRTFVRANPPIDVTQVNAVQINARLGSSAGTLPLAFGRLVGLNTYDTTKRALGVIGAPVAAKPTAPIAVDKGLFTGKRRGFTSPDDIVVSTKDPANAYWTGYFGGANASVVKNMVEDPSLIPTLTVKVDKISLAGGNMTADYQAMKARWNPGDEIIIPVVNTDPDQTKGLVVGFALMRINAIKATGNPKYISGELLSKKIVGYGDQATVGECFGFNCRAYLAY